MEAVNYCYRARLRCDALRLDHLDRSDRLERLERLERRAVPAIIPSRPARLGVRLTEARLTP